MTLRLADIFRMGHFNRFATAVASAARVGALEETVTVTGASPLVDVHLVAIEGVWPYHVNIWDAKRVSFISAVYDSVTTINLTAGGAFTVECRFKGIGRGRHQTARVMTLQTRGLVLVVVSLAGGLITPAACG